MGLEVHLTHTAAVVVFAILQFYSQPGAYPMKYFTFFCRPPPQCAFVSHFVLNNAAQVRVAFFVKQENGRQRFIWFCIDDIGRCLRFRMLDGWKRGTNSPGEFAKENIAGGRSKIITFSFIAVKIVGHIVALNHS